MANENTPKINYTCPCCGYMSFSGPPGSYEICDVCGWEDDLSQLRFPTTTGANKKNLIDAQEHFKLYAVDPKISDEYQKDPKWRLLDEKLDNIEIPTVGTDYGENYPDDSLQLYYWLPTYWRI